jgi:glycogen operon protein
MIAFRLKHPGFMRPEFYTGREGHYNASPDISWYKEKGASPDWEKIGYGIGLKVYGRKTSVKDDIDDADFFIMFNAGLDPVVFSVPPANNHKHWFRVVDTSLNSPNDILPEGSEEPIAHLHKYQVNARSTVILISKGAENG